MLDPIPKDSKIVALIEFAILTSDKGDYVLQALTLKDINPNGW
jgi:hypothetical protein